MENDSNYSDNVIISRLFLNTNNQFDFIFYLIPPINKMSEIVTLSFPLSYIFLSEDEDEYIKLSSIHPSEGNYGQISFIKVPELTLGKINRSILYKINSNEILQAVDNSYNPYNPEMKNGIVATFAISPCSQILIHNYGNFLSCKPFGYKFVSLYKYIFLGKNRTFFDHHSIHLFFHSNVVKLIRLMIGKNNINVIGEICNFLYFDNYGVSMLNDNQLKMFGWHLYLSQKRDSIKMKDITGPPNHILAKKNRKIEKMHKIPPVKIVSNFPQFKLQRQGQEIICPIPHKCWSPEGDSILFVGCQEKSGRSNVYSVNVKTKKIKKILNVNDSSGDFNPDLDWTKDGIVITCKNNMYFSKCGDKIEKLAIPFRVDELKGGKLSPSGKIILFLGRKEEKIYLFCFDPVSRTIYKKEVGSGDLRDFECGWILKQKRTIIKNEYDYYILADIYDLNTLYNLTPLHNAVRNRRPDLAKLLLEIGVEVNAKDNEGLTALHYAILPGKTTELFHSSSIMKESSSERKSNYLYFATEFCSKKLILMLIFYGANVNSKDSFGRTPLYYAKLYKQIEVINILQKFGGKD